MNPVADRVGDLTPEWITEALRHAGLDVTVTRVEADRIGTGQIGTSYRLWLTYADSRGSAPPTLVAKLAGGNAEDRQRVAFAYVKEVGFYKKLIHTLEVRTPRCWYGAITDDHTSFTLLLDDLSAAVPGVQVDGCTAEQAADCVVNLAGLHAPRWNDKSLLEIDFLTPADEATASFLGDVLIGATEEFVARYEADLHDTDIATLRDSAQVIGAWQLARPRPFAVVHGDYRLDNLMFPLHGDGVTALDWQTVTVGPPTRDVAYFLGTSLKVQTRRAHEQDLVATYHRALADRGIEGYDLQSCYCDYRLGHLQGPMITVLGCLYATAERTQRSDSMFLAMATRSCAAIRDHGSIDLVAPC